MNVSKIKSELKHGALKRIAKETNLHYITIVNIMNGKNPTSPKFTLVLSKALEVLEEQKQQDAELTAKFNEVVNYGAI